MTSCGPRLRWTGGAAILALTTALLMLALTGCGAPETSTENAGTSSGRITVAAAASLQGAFTEMERAFEAANPGTSVDLVLGASSMLAQQIINGAPVDVFAAADEPTMARVVAANMVSGPPKIFATNTLEIIVRRGNPSNITSIEDLSRSGLVYVTCAQEVPVGSYASQVLENAGVRVRPASLEPDVRGIVAKVTSGEADAGIVYATDIRATNGAATGVSIPRAINVVTSYPIAALDDASNPELASTWIAFVSGTEGRTILTAHGFTTP